MSALPRHRGSDTEYYRQRVRELQARTEQTLATLKAFRAGKSRTNNEMGSAPSPRSGPPIAGQPR
jgi:hypothetical protein